MSLWGYKKKGKPANWMSAFPKQAAKLRPETPQPKRTVAPQRAKRIKPRSTERSKEEARYRREAAKFKRANPKCACCKARGLAEKPTEHVHHTRGRIHGLLLDQQFWVGVCFPCHRWIEEHMDEARQIGMLCDRGLWNTTAMPAPTPTGASLQAEPSKELGNNPGDQEGRKWPDVTTLKT